MATPWAAFRRGIGLLAQGRAGLSSRPSCARCVRERRRVHTTGDARGGGSGRAGSSTASRRERFSSLSPRELEVASLVAEGLSSVEIAKRLTIEAASVRRTVSRVLAKLGMRDRVQIAVAWWRGQGSWRPSLSLLGWKNGLCELDGECFVVRAGCASCDAAVREGHLFYRNAPIRVGMRRL